MPFAFGHLLGGWIIGNLWNKKLSNISWFLLLFGAVLPDIDFLFEWTLMIPIHRTITHSLLFCLTIVLLTYLTTKNKQYSFAFGIGILSHITLDFVWGSGVQILWPYQTYLTLFSSTGFLTTSTTLARGFSKTIMLIDMALGTAWILLLILFKKINLKIN